MIDSKRESCYLCGSIEQLTKDHIPPKNLFRPPRPTNLITLPACFQCNNSFKLDDEYFRVAMATQGYFHDAGKWIWENKVVGSTFRRSPALRSALRQAIVPLSPKQQSKMFPEAEKGVAFDRARIIRVIDKIVRGLFRHHYSPVMLDPSIKLDIWMVSPGKALAEFSQSLRMEALGGDTFVYWRGVWEEDARKSVWLLSFYRRTFFGVSTLGALPHNNG